MRNKLTLAMLLGCSLAMAKSVERPNSYNYNRGLEALQNYNMEEATEFLKKELKDNPNNGYAYIWLAVVRQENKENGLALSNANTALKKLPKKDIEYISFAYNRRSDIYLALEDTTSAIKDMESAINLDSENSELYKKRAQIYFEQNKYEEANKDYEKMISLDEGNVVGYVGKARNLNAQKRYAEALPLLDHVTKLSKNYSTGYAHRAECYLGLKNYDKALDDVIKALAINENDLAFYTMITLADSAFTETATKLKVQQLKEPNEQYWDYCLGVVYEHNKYYDKAIASYKSSLKKEASDVTAKRISECYMAIGDYEQAISYIDIAIGIDSTDYRHPLTKADIYNCKGQSDLAIEELNKLIAKYPDFSFAYWQRGWYKEFSKDLNGALEDYSISIGIKPDYANGYLCRGRIYTKKNEEEKSKADFRKCIELEKEKQEIGSHSIFSYYYLGEKEKALQLLQKSLTDGTCHEYNAACIYSMIGNIEKALEYLQKTLENGYNVFVHLERDNELDNIRNTTEFKKLISEYKAKVTASIEAENKEEAANYTEKVVKIPFTKEGRVNRVKCTINGLPLHFIFDTGASDVTISSVEAAFMLKNDYLKKQDFGGNQYYQTANGDIAEGTNIILRNITFGGLTLENVKASVVKSQSAPLLLGQSVLSRLGKIEIDNERRVLIITHKEKKN